MSEQPEKRYYVHLAPDHNGYMIASADSYTYIEAVALMNKWLHIHSDVIHHGYWIGTRSGEYLGHLVEAENER